MTRASRDDAPDGPRLVKTQHDGAPGESPMRIRDYRPADMAACLRVFESNVPTFFSREERPGLVEFLGALPGPYLVLEDEDGTVLGCGGYAINRGDGTADLCWGMIHAERQGTGLGRWLLRERIARALTAPQVRRLRLNTSQHTTGFFERFGFVIGRVVKDGYAPGLDLCEMTLDVESTR